MWDLKELVALTELGQAAPSTRGSRGRPGWPRLIERFGLAKPLIGRAGGYRPNPIALTFFCWPTVGVAGGETAPLRPAQRLGMPRQRSRARRASPARGSRHGGVPRSALDAPVFWARHVDI
ncbi:hypothetical protein [Micromonospora sp. M71_S20]|uniref:hypothetical protein n=1 Tax=Micromonospora sp. M71_S20 TaxID=592872 RepID=UPI0018F6B358|nr:hypothetical protein [Micromonospora sp. M71_S20]